MEIISNSTSETQKLAQRIAKEAIIGDIYALYGGLGSGKTTFTKYFVEALGIQARVQSPTFVIARHYKGTGINGITVVNHLDLYRLTEKADLLDLDLEESFSKRNTITIIEWPELAEEFLPESTKRMYFEDKGENTKCIKYS